MHSAAYVTAIMAMLTATEARSSTNQPGSCEDDTSCESNYTCVSVQTTRAGATDVKQCLPYNQEGDVCSGIFMGLCPSFSTWTTAYQSISSVCAYQLPSGTDQCLNSSVESDAEGYVTCINIRESNTSDQSIGVIYGCVDFDGTNLLFEENSASWELSNQMDYASLINEECRNPQNGDNSDVVCSGRGTCSPRTSGGMNYECLCNVGYNGTYCQNIVSNRCTLESQCQAGTCNLVTQECECEPGTTGDQCAYCDPTSSDACNGRGTCSAPVLAPVTGNNNVRGAAGALLNASLNSNINSVGAALSNTTSSNLMSTNGTSATQGSGTRFLLEMQTNAGSGSGNVCQCDSGYTGDQCTRKVESNSSDSDPNRPNTVTGDAASLATSIVVVVSVFVVAFLN